jgi:hypothetical protein
MTQMKFLMLSAAAMVMTISATAGSVQEACTPFSASDGQSYFGVGAVTSGTSNCAAFSALPVGDTFVSVELVLQADYTGGGGVTNATATTWGPVILADTINVTGTGVSTSWLDYASCGNTSSNVTCTPNDPAQGTNYFETVLSGVNSTNYTTAISEAYSVAVTSGQVQGVSGQIFAVLNYTTTTGTPEPASMILLGSGLLAAGLIGRKKLVRK